MKKQETKLKEKVLSALKLRFPNSWFCKIQQVSINGTPDILGCHCGVFVAIELKTEDQGSKLSPIQIYELERISKAAGFVWVIKNLGELDIMLKELVGLEQKYNEYAKESA